MGKLLIVEDQTDIRRLLEIYFSKQGHQVWGAGTGNRALALAHSVKPDVVLLDVMLPGGVDGYEVTRSLKGDPDTSSCAVIITTAKGQDEDRTEAFAAGADAYVRKPYQLNDLVSQVGHYC